MSHEYDPFKHRRQSIRLKSWDYGTRASYFITICTHQRAYLFTDPLLSKVASSAWEQLPAHPKSQNITLDEFVIMPDHMHAILIVLNQVSEPLKSPRQFENVQSGTVGRFIGTYKALVTRRINKLRGSVGDKVWLRGYWDRIIRSEREFYAVQRYIRDNPMRWAQKRENIDKLTDKMTFHG